MTHDDLSCRGSRYTTGRGKRGRGAGRGHPGEWVEPMENRVLLSVFVVTTTADGPGTVAPAGAGTFTATTLRAALTAANAKPDADVIRINPTLTGTIKLNPALGELAITSPLTLQGAGANRQGVDGNGAVRVFSVAAGVTASIEGLTVSNGTSPSTGGGGIRNLGTLALRAVTVRDNEVGVDGAGVFNTGTLTVSGSTFTGNVAKGGGGGLYNAGTATVVNPTFAGNRGDFGGGLYNASGAHLRIVNSTISGNHAATSGGGIAGTVANPATTPAGTRLDNTIVAGNTFGPTTTGQGPDLYGFFDAASSNNLIGSLGFAKGLDRTKNLLGRIENATPAIDPLLSPLGYYGGTTQTMPPRTGSPAINAGNNALVPAGVTTDQRGLPRIVGGRVDIGAVEVQPPAPTPPPPPPPPPPVVNPGGGKTDKDKEKNKDKDKQKGNGNGKANGQGNGNGQGQGNGKGNGQ